MKGIKYIVAILGCGLMASYTYSQQSSDSAIIDINKFNGRRMSELADYFDHNSIQSDGCRALIHKVPYCNGIIFSYGSYRYTIWFERDRKILTTEILADIQSNCLNSKYIRERQIAEIEVRKL